MAVRALVAVPPIAVFTVVLGLLAILAGLVDRSGRASRSLSRLWGRLLLATCGIRVRRTGAENVLPGSAVFAANHASAMDAPILFGHLRVDFVILHKRSLYKAPFVGWALFFGRHIAVARENPFRARRCLAEAAGRVRAGANLVIFPEGTRSPDGSIRAFKRGSFVLALESGAPLVPISLVGVKTVVPAGFFSLRPGTVELRIHPPVPTAGRSADDAGTLAREVREIVAQGCAAGAA